jgi:hypothetical protein
MTRSAFVRTYGRREAEGVSRRIVRCSTGPQYSSIAWRTCTSSILHSHSGKRVSVDAAPGDPSLSTVGDPKVDCRCCWKSGNDLSRSMTPCASSDPSGNLNSNDCSKSPSKETIMLCHRPPSDAQRKVANRRCPRSSPSEKLAPFQSASNSFRPFQVVSHGTSMSGRSSR